MQVLSDDISSLCLLLFTFFLLQSYHQQYDVCSVCWTPPSVGSTETNIPITLNKNWPIVKLGHTQFIHIINTCYLDIDFRLCYLFSFWLVPVFHKTLIAFCPCFPFNSVTFKGTSPNLNCQALLFFSQDCQCFQYLAQSNAVKRFHLLFSSTIPQILSFFYPMAFSSLYHLPLPWWAFVPLSQHEAYVVMEAHTPRLLLHEVVIENLAFLLLHFLMKNCLLAFICCRRSYSNRDRGRMWTLFKLIIVILWYLFGILGVILLFVMILFYLFGFGSHG